jgi:hypothetical protein
MLYVRYAHFTRPVIFIREKPILSSERMLHNTARVQLKKSLIVSLKGLGAKTN